MQNMMSLARVKSDIRRLDRLEKAYNWRSTPLTQEEQDHKGKCEESLAYFMEHFWYDLQGREFTPGKVIEVICLHLEALYDLQIQNLIINQPFRTGKTIMSCVMFPAWVWVQNPNLRFVCNAYAQSLTTEASDNCRRVIQSARYQRYWGDKVSIRPDWNNKLSFRNTAGGWRKATSIDGANTGSGGDVSILDDPNSMREVNSESIQVSTNNFIDNVLTSRFEDPATHRRLVVQQRGGLRDATSHLLQKDLTNWVHVCLPMEYIPSRHCVTIPLKNTNGKPWEDWRKEEGELLWPERFPKERIDDLKAEFNHNQHVINCQLQQNPTSEEWGRIREHWFKKWNQPFFPHLIYKIQSWDTAMVSSPSANYSSCSTWGVFEDENKIRNIILLGLFAGQLNYPDLRRMALRLAHNWNDSIIEQPISVGEIRAPKRSPNHVIIEKKVSGYCLFDDLLRAGVPVLGFKPNKHGTKEDRCNKVTDLIENGQVWLPCRGPKFTALTSYSQDFLDAAVLFPSNRRGSDVNDIIDSMSQAFITLKGNGWISNHSKLSDM